jgi:hypothetical protein
VWNNLGSNVGVPLPEASEVPDGVGAEDDRHLVLRTSGSWQRWAPWRVAPGTPIGPASELFPKIDPAVVDEEIARLAKSA